MKKYLFVLAALLAIVACNKKPMTAKVENEESCEVAFEVAKNYFYNHNVGLPTAKITTDEDFKKFFGMATLMGEDGKPTPIDFSKQFVIDVILPVSDWAMEINPVKVESKGDTLFYSYDVKVGEKQSSFSQPISIIILDKGCEKQEVVLVNDQDITYDQAIDRYLVNEIGKDYTEGEHCVPFYSIVSTDASNAADIKIWGDFWVNNYNQVGDTLKCVSGGSHPGLMHLQQTEKGFAVTSFDQVADGADNLPSAKKIFGDKYESFQKLNSNEEWREQVRIDKLEEYATKNNLTATMLQDYGWPVKSFKKIEEN